MVSAGASSATSLYFQYDNLEKVQTRVDQTEPALRASKANRITAQTRLCELVSKGVTSGPMNVRIDAQLSNDGVLTITKVEVDKPANLDLSFYK